MHVQLHHCRLTNKTPKKVLESTIFPKPDEVDDNAKEKGVPIPMYKLRNKPPIVTKKIISSPIFFGMLGSTTERIIWNEKF